MKTKMNTAMKITIGSFLIGLGADLVLCMTSNKIVYGVAFAVFFACMLGFTLTAHKASTVAVEDKSEALDQTA